jgi:hypothetical protein
MAALTRPCAALKTGAASKTRHDVGQGTLYTINNWAPLFGLGVTGKGTRRQPVPAWPILHLLDGRVRSGLGSVIAPSGRRSMKPVSSAAVPTPARLVVGRQQATATNCAPVTHNGPKPLIAEKNRT